MTRGINKAFQNIAFRVCVSGAQVSLITAINYVVKGKVCVNIKADEIVDTKCIYII